MTTVSSSIGDEIIECPLCMEPLEVDDLNFFPCTCGYQICRFCWHRIRTDENELCPACRKEYPENPADFKPLSQEEMIAFKFQKRQRDQQRKQKITENRKHLANVRVVQKNLVFVVGLPPRLANAEILKKHEYFGKYGRIHKVVINPSTTYAGVQGPSASAYVTYVLNSDALRAIQSVNNIMIDGRVIKTSLGTTKYCSHFMKNQQCPKSDCMYLHELGDPEASFTKEEMHQGKHQDYEKRLHELLQAGTFVNGSSSSTASDIGLNTISKSTENRESSLNTIASVNFPTGNSIATINPSNCASEQKKEAWPTLSMSPVNQKEPLATGSNKKIKERFKQEKGKTEKNAKLKIKTVVSQNIINTSTTLRDVENSLDLTHSLFPDYLIEKTGKNKKDNLAKNATILEIEMPSAQSKANNNLTEKCLKSEDNTMVSKAVNHSMYKINENQASEIKDESTKKHNEHKTDNVKYQTDLQQVEEAKVGYASKNCTLNLHEETTNSKNDELGISLEINLVSETDKALHSALMTDTSSFSDCTPGNISYIEPLEKESLPTSKALKKSKLDGSVQTNGRMKPNLPDLITGIDGYQRNTSCDNDWENAFQNVVLKTTKDNDNNLQEPHIYQTDESYHIKYFEDLRRLQDIHRRNALLNSISSSHLNLTRTGAELYRNSQNVDQQCELLQQKNMEREAQNFSSETNMSKFFDFHKHQQQRMQMQNIHISNGNFVGLSENMQMMSLLDTKKNTQYVENNSLTPSKSQYIRSQNLCGKSDPMICYHQHHSNQSNQSSYQSQYIQQSYADDDLGFDPFVETQKALAELIENEEESHNETAPAISKPESKQQTMYHQLSPNDQTLDSVHLLRRNQVDIYPNNFGIYNNSQRMQNSSKILPFVNITSNNVESCSHPNQQHQSANVWGANMSSIQPYPACTDIRRAHLNQSVDNSKSYSCSDWTAMDPAILSFRQFSFPQHNQMSSQPEQDMFLQQITHNQQPTVFGQQSQHGGRSNIHNTALSPHHNSHAQVAANVQGMLEYLKNRQCM